MATLMRPPGNIKCARLAILRPTAGNFEANTQLSIVSPEMLVVPRNDYNATFLPTGKILVTGGYRYESSGKQFTTKPDNIPSRTVWLRDAELVDPATNSSERVGSLRQARHHYATVVQSNGEVMIIGGTRDVGGYLSSTEIFNPRTKSFASGPALSIARSYHVASVLKDGSILITGGLSKRSDYETMAEILKPNAKQFQPVGQLAIGRTAHQATLLNSGKLLITGGQNIFHESDDYSVKMAELYQPETQTFTSGGLLISPRAEHQCNLLNDGSAILSGGEHLDRRELQSEYQKLKSTEVFECSYY